MYLVFSPLIGQAAEVRHAADLQQNVIQSQFLVNSIRIKLIQGASVDFEISQLKSTVENVRISNLLLEEHFRLREEKVKSLGSKAVSRHNSMAEGYRKALMEYLDLVERLIPPDGQKHATSDQLSALDKLTPLFEKLLPKKKRPLIGSLPYKHLNYPAQEPSTAPTITPAYKGGNIIVSPDDTKTTEEAPLSKEIAALAQTLKWQPIAIYEYVKNNVETEWYWGCMKGAEETLHQKSGNDCDQATLLTSLLRASGFPTRYVRGAMQFFAGGKNGVPMDRIKNLIGIDDPVKIAEFFQKAGIPNKPVIQGGKITNFQIEHIWTESFIPYANYRGNVIDDNGKIWLGLDTSIKVKNFAYNNPQDIFQEPAISARLSAIRDEYLGITSSGTGSTACELNQTPLEYLHAVISSELQVQNSPLVYADFQHARTLPEEHLGILPNSMQITLVKATDEYISIPDELVHKVKLSAVSCQPSANTDKLFEITLPLYKLSNQQVAITYEPETVEDQEIINSYGGLDNTPAYLVRLRPVLTLNGDRIVVANDGMPMGSEYDLTVELIAVSGNQTSEKITNTHIVGNLSVIGITAGKAVITPSPPAGEGGGLAPGVSERAGGEGGNDAEHLLYEAAQHYIDRWNKAENELASLLHLTIARPLPAVVTLGGVIDVTYVMGIPHNFTWKGDFIDAGFRAVEAVSRTPDPGDSTRLFTQLSSLQGSVLEHKVFEDDFQVPSISTAKLFQLVNHGAGLIAIDKTNIDSVLPTLNLDDTIKEDMINAVNQGFKLFTPNSELTYRDWTGIGYLKENPDTGDAGWMLSGMIAGGMTTVSPDKWTSQDNGTILSNPYNDNSRNIFIISPANEATVSTPAVVVTGVVLDPEATVTVNGKQADVQNGMFKATIYLTSGTNTLNAVATNKAGRSSSDTIFIRYKIPLQMAVTYPFDSADLAVTPIYVEGYVNDPSAVIYVMGVKAQVGQDGHFIANGVQLSEGANQIIASAMNADGDVASQTLMLNYHVPQTQPSLSVSITSPANGAAINKPSTTVIGTYTSSADEVWISVNGMPAVIYGNHFVVNNVPLADGSNRIVVNAMDSKGAMGRKETNVIADTTASYITLHTNIQSGTLPLKTSFSLDSNIMGTPVSYLLDFGDGSTPYNGTAFDYVEHTYSSEGIFHPIVTVADTAGNTFTDSVIVTVLDYATMNSYFIQKWNGMKSALGSGNIARAMTYYANDAQNIFSQRFSSANLMTSIPDIVSMMGPFRLVTLKENIAECELRIDKDDETYSFQVLYIRDPDSNWEIFSY